MWIKAGILGDPGTRSSNLAVWTMAGLGITIGLYSCRKWVEYSIRKLDVFAWEENDNGIGRLSDDILCSNFSLLGALEASRTTKENNNGIDRLSDDILVNIVSRLGALEASRTSEENDNVIDRLSDDILCNIVSRLGALEASRTSILSKRWRNIWTMNPELMFTCLGTLDVSKRNHDKVAYVDRRRFLKGVNQCLQLYSGRNLKHFFLHCCFLYGHACQLVRWMQTLAGFDVEELYLGVSCRTCIGHTVDKPFNFSFKLIDGFSRLEYLDLTACYVETTFASQCNSLMTVTLRRIPSLSHQLSDILMSCPNLTSLCIEICELPPNLRISGPNLKLKFLKLYVCYNVQKLEISDINIESIKIDIRTEVEVLLSSVPKLEKLHLRTPGMNYCFADAPRQMPQLKYLLVQPKYQILGLPPNFQVFGNVRILRLTTKGYPYAEACEEVDIWNFAPVLVACPLLEKFYLLVGGPACKEEREGQWPVVRHKHLEYMEWSGFSGTRNELEFANFIVTSAEVLQTLLLRICFRGYDDGKGPYFEDEKDSKQIDPGVALACLLKDDFLSEHAALKFELPEK